MTKAILGKKRLMQQKKWWQFQFVWFPVVFWLYIFLFIGASENNNWYLFSNDLSFVILGVLLTITIWKFPFYEIITIAFTIFVFTFYFFPTKAVATGMACLILLFVGSLFGKLMTFLADKLDIKKKMIAPLNNVFAYINFYKTKPVLYWIHYLIAIFVFMCFSNIFFACNFKVLILLTFVIGILEVLIAKKDNYVWLSPIAIFVLPICFSGTILIPKLTCWVYALLSYFLGLASGYKLRRQIKQL